MRNIGICIFLVMTGLLYLPKPSMGQTGNKIEDKALVERASAFVAAFNKGDAKTLSEFWTPKGLYQDEKGIELKGREAIAKSYEAFFAESKGLKLSIRIKSIKSITDDVMMEEGISEVTSSDGSPPSQVNYMIVHVKKDGIWYLDVVKDSVYTPPNNYKQLSDLEWVIGSWTSENEKGSADQLNFIWGPNQNFIIGTFQTAFESACIGAGTQWIGWDPKAKGIRSWSFDDSGAFGESTWSVKDKKWSVKTQTTLRDGRILSATSIVTILSSDSISWQSINRSIDDKTLADSSPVKMKRVK